MSLISVFSLQCVLDVPVVGNVVVRRGVNVSALILDGTAAVQGLMIRFALVRMPLVLY